MFKPLLRPLGTVYVVLAVDKFSHATVSQDSYTTLKEAQRFCLSREGVVDCLDDYTFIGCGYLYKIYSTTLKGD